MNYRIGLVIVNYKTADLVINCLQSLDLQFVKDCNLDVVIVDNDSRDNSVEIIQNNIDLKNWHSWSTVIASEKNGGFAYGNNIGVDYLMSKKSYDYFVFLNPDTIVKPNAILTLVEYINENSYIGIAGSSLENSNGLVEQSAHRFPTPWSELMNGASSGILHRLLHRYALSPSTSEVSHRCDWVSGACMIIRKQVFESIGFMDDNFFLYFEEVDFCFRAKNRGWEVWYVPEARVMHIEGAATGIKHEIRRPSYWYNSRRRFFVKQYGLTGLFITDFLWFVGRVYWILKGLLTLKIFTKGKGPKWYMYDLLVGDLKALFSGELFNVNRNPKNKTY